MAERADDGTVLETPFDGVDRVDVQSVRFLPRAGVREEGWFGTRPTGGTARALAIQTMDGYEPSGTSPSVVAPGMASVDASKHARDDVSDKARRTPRRNLPRRIHRSNHAHAVASLVNRVSNVVSSAFPDVSADKTVTLSMYKQLTIASMIRPCAVYC
jgi:hypothetical protein